MTFALRILRRAERSLAALPSPSYERVRDAIRALGHEARPRGCKKLTARPGWRIRVGPFRVIYEIDEESQTITILDIGYRRDVYR